MTSLWEALLQPPLDAVVPATGTRAWCRCRDAFQDTIIMDKDEKELERWGEAFKLKEVSIKEVRPKPVCCPLVPSQPRPFCGWPPRNTCGTLGQ